MQIQGVGLKSKEIGWNVFPLADKEGAERGHPISIYTSVIREDVVNQLNEYPKVNNISEFFFSLVYIWRKQLTNVCLQKLPASPPPVDCGHDLFFFYWISVYLNDVSENENAH